MQDEPRRVTGRVTNVSVSHLFTRRVQYSNGTLALAAPRLSAYTHVDAE